MGLLIYSKPQFQSLCLHQHRKKHQDNSSSFHLDFLTVPDLCMYMSLGQNKSILRVSSLV